MFGCRTFCQPSLHYYSFQASKWWSRRANRVVCSASENTRRFSRRASASTNTGNFFRMRDARPRLRASYALVYDINGRRYEGEAIRGRRGRSATSSRVVLVLKPRRILHPDLENWLFQRRAVRHSPLLLFLLLLLALECARALVQRTLYNVLEAECFSSVSHFLGRHGIFGKTILPVPD